MINWALASRWENWVYIFLMISIFLVAAHMFIDFIDKDKEQN